jgi:lysophospholipase L1-like esterase
MVYPLITLGLGPVLLLQGRRVRRDTPRLPEAAGPRSGVAGKGDRLRLLIIGDSAAAGVGASRQDDALAGRLVAALAERYTVAWRLIATTGHALNDVLQEMHTAEAEDFDVVVTSIGVNDATAGTALKTWRAQQQKLMTLLKEKFAVRHILVSAVPPMHHFPALPQPLRWYMGLRAQRLNRALALQLQNDAEGELVMADFPLEDGYMASDGFHPGPLAYAVWAAQIDRVLARRLRHR